MLQTELNSHQRSLGIGCLQDMQVTRLVRRHMQGRLHRRSPATTQDRENKATWTRTRRTEKATSVETTAGCVQVLRAMPGMLSKASCGHEGNSQEDPGLALILDAKSTVDHGRCSDWSFELPA